jgi:hypothetical protein
VLTTSGSPPSTHQAERQRQVGFPPLQTRTRHRATGTNRDPSQNFPSNRRDPPRDYMDAVLLRFGAIAAPDGLVVSFVCFSSRPPDAFLHQSFGIAKPLGLRRPASRLDSRRSWRTNSHGLRRNSRASLFALTVLLTFNAISKASTHAASSHHQGSGATSPLLKGPCGQCDQWSSERTASPDALRPWSQEIGPARVAGRMDRSK